MTLLLETAIERLKALSQAEQDAFASHILRQLPSAPEWGERWQHLGPAERAAEFRAWITGLSGGPRLPDAAFGRDAIYEDEA